MRLFEDPQLGPILVAPAPLLRSLLLRIVSQSNPSNGLLTEPAPTGEETEVPKIVLCPLTTETAEELMNPLTRASPFPILVLCDTEGFEALVSLEGPDVEGYEEVVNSAFRVVREKTPGALLRPQGLPLAWSDIPNYHRNSDRRSTAVNSIVRRWPFSRWGSSCGWFRLG